MTPATSPSTDQIIDRNPSTGEVLATIPCADAEQVTDAVARARGAAGTWARLGLEGRLAVIERCAARFEDETLTERLAGLITAEMGKPLASARKEAGSMAGAVRRLAKSAAEALAPVETRESGLITRLSREPLGVVAAISPWNFPLAMAREIVIPALVAGNTVVFKPSELTPLCGAVMAEELCAELPTDVLVLVQGEEATGKALVAADVDMVGFVGSVSAGRHIMGQCARDLKRLVLELGGKDPMIVCADADLEQAADFAVRESMRNTGQVCCSVERIYVEAEAAPRFTELVVDKARKLTVGDGRDDVFMGPMASEGFQQAVLSQIDDARSRGARIALGGKAPDGPGHFIEPTVVTDVDESMALMTEETFGPVATIRTVGSADEAVDLANASEFGLGASVWAGDAERGRSLAARIEAGQVGVNRGLGGAGDPPWAGVKHSGFGFLGSPDGYRQFSRPHTMSWNEA